jgi:hypothetical protein
LFGLMGFVATTVIGGLGFLIRRAILTHDQNEVATQELIQQNTDRIHENFREAMVKIQDTMDETLREAKLTNHRITSLEAIEVVRKEFHHERTRESKDRMGRGEHA